MIFFWQYRKRALAAEAQAAGLLKQNAELRQKLNDAAPVFAALSVANKQVVRLTEQVRQMSIRR